MRVFHAVDNAGYGRPWSRFVVLCVCNKCSGMQTWCSCTSVLYVALSVQGHPKAVGNRYARNVRTGTKSIRF